MVARHLGVVEAVGSSPVTQTKGKSYRTYPFLIFCDLFRLLHKNVQLFPYFSLLVKNIIMC